MAVSSLSLNFASKPLSHKSGARGWISPAECAAVSITNLTKTSSFDDESKIMQNAQTYIHTSLKYFVTRYYDQILLVPSSKSRISKRAIKMVECNPSFSCLSAQFALSGNCKRRALVLGMGALTLNPLQASHLLAEGIPEKYNIFVDKVDGYSYYYPSDWRDFDFLGHDSAFKDRSLQLQNVRLSFIPTNKTDVRDLGPMDEVVFHLVNDVYSAPNQVGDILDMQEKNIDGRNYWTFEYVLTSPNFSRAAFATIAIANGRYYTLIVGANQRRWRKYRNMLKVVADSFKVMEI